nr:CopG family transcriptional regulator [Natronolimnobius baerhuensis]
MSQLSASRGTPREGRCCAEITHTNRTEVIKKALQQYFEAVEDDERFNEALIELYLDEEVGFETLKEFVGRQDAEAVRASKAVLEQGDDLADELADLE